MTKEQIRDLVKRYAIECNDDLTFGFLREESKAFDLYGQLNTAYLEGQAELVVSATAELILSDELPEPVRTFWRTGHLPQTSV